MNEEQLFEAVINLIKQVERLNERIPAHIDWVEKEMQDHETRIRNLEQFRWILLGIAIASGGLFTGITKWMGW